MKKQNTQNKETVREQALRLIREIQLAKRSDQMSIILGIEDIKVVKEMVIIMTSTYNHIEEKEG